MKFGRKEVYESACKLCGQLISNVRQIRIDNDNNNGYNNNNNNNNDNNNSNNNNNNNNNNDYTSLSPYCHNFSNLLLSKIESKFNLKDGIDNIATCICSISKYCPEFLERSLFLRIMTTFRRLKPRGRYEFLQAVYNSSGHFFSSSSSSPSATYTFGDNNNINNANSNNDDNNYNNNNRGTENWENDGDINDEKEHERVNERKQERGRDGRSGGMSVIDHLRPFISSLLADLSTVVIRYEDSSLDSSIPDSDPGSLLPRRRLPMVQLLTVKLLIRYAETLDITLIDQLVRSDTQGNDSGDLGSDSITDGFGLSLVLNEKAVLTV